MSGAEEGLTVDQLVDLIRKEAERLEDVKIYFALRQYHFRPITKKAVHLVKVCLSIDSLGFPITPRLIQSFVKWQLRDQLHRLGDKHILVLKRRELPSTFEWTVHPTFKKLVE